MRELYPPLEPNTVHRLDVEPPHRVCVEECGNPRGMPVVFLHGGPGSGCKSYHRQFFDPARYRIVLFDQRGCGRSSPPGETQKNSTPLLLTDLETIRNRLGIDRWLLFGGSWGTTLALLYAQAHPDRVLGMILRGTFLARQQDLDWFFGSGVDRIFPDYRESLRSRFPVEERGDLIAACYRRMQSDDAELRWQTAQAWSAWTGGIVTYLLAEGEAKPPTPEDRQRTINEVAIETHYAYHRYFIDENQILDRIARLPPVPMTIVHGRRDLTCPLESSWALHRALPKSKLVVVREAGHLASEPAMVDALVTVTDEMVRLLS